MTAADTENSVREAFKVQARYCRELGSPFTALLCEVIGQRLRPDTEVGARILSWDGQPDAMHDSVPLRLAGALHALAMRKTDRSLTRLYPPNPIPRPESLWPTLRRVLVAEESEVLRWLDLPPQTNEVARSAILMAGLLVIACETKLPLALYEAGASGGLNLVPDKYSCCLGGVEVGMPDSGVRLRPEWRGAAPPSIDLKIVRRRGVDLMPLDLSTPEGRERLRAYVWPDQSDRLARMDAALAIAAADPPRIDRGDAADWIENEIGIAPEPGIARVLMHSIAFQYFSAESRKRIADHVARIGANANTGAAFAWLRMEGLTKTGIALTLTVWPEGRERVLAYVHAHGKSVEWL
jgi:hypothetical protein